MNATYVSFDELLAQSDVLSLNCPLTPETKEVINAEAFKTMKDGAYFVNTARVRMAICVLKSPADAQGGCVDEAALIEALKSGKLAGAGLDVFAVEPLDSSPLFDLPNVMVIPHCGAFTRGTITRGEKEVFANVAS